MNPENDAIRDVSQDQRSNYRRVTVAILVVMICIGLTTHITIQYLNYRIEQKYNMTIQHDTGRTQCLNDTNDAETSLQDQIQQEVAAWSLALHASAAFPALISTVILATMSDTIGRKIPLIISCVGMTASTLAFIAISFFSLPLSYLVITNLVCNWCGSYQLFFAVCAAYVADTVSRQKRTVKFIILQTVVYLGSGVSQLGVGYWIQASGFIPPYCLAAALFTALIPYLVLAVPETVTDRKTSCLVFIQLFRSVKNLFVDNTKRRRYKLLLLLLSYFPAYLCLMYYLPLVMLKVLSKPLCWGPVLIGYLSAMLPITNGIGLMLGGYLLPFCLGDYGMIQAGLISGILMMLITGLDSSTIAVLIVPVFGMLRNISLAVLMASLSKVVNDNEQGTLFAFVGALESLGLFLAPVTLGVIYKTTLAWYASFVFDTMAGILLLATFCIGILQVMDFNEMKLYKRIDTTDSLIEDDAENNTILYETDAAITHKE